MSHFRSFPSQVRKPLRGLKRLQLLAALVVATPLAACTGADRIVTKSIASDEVGARHPIELSHSRANLDVVAQVHGGEIDRRTEALVKQFAEAYKANGSGDIGIAFPSGGPFAAEARAALPGLRKALVSGGARGYVVVSSYPVADPRLAAPIRLSYATLVAQVRTRCGQWPNDLAGGASTGSWENKSYYNFGCASQQMLAAQTADPRDLMGPSAETPPDSYMRGRGIDDVRKGSDPGTHWIIQNSNIGGVGN